MAETKLVRMERETPDVEGGPLTADVHPDNVADFQAHGWTVSNGGSSDTQEAPKRRKKTEVAE